MALGKRLASTPPVGDHEGSLQGAQRSRAYNYWLATALSQPFKVSRAGIALIWSIIAVATFLVGSWVIDTKSPVELISATVIPESGSPGGRVMTYYKVKVLRGFDQCTLDVERSWLDAHGNEWPSTTIHLKYAPSTVDIGLNMAIPMDAWAGISMVENTMVSTCNPWQKLFPRREMMPPLQVNVQR